MKTQTLNTADFAADIDFSLMVTTFSYVRADFATYAHQVRNDCHEFLRTCWCRLTKLKRLTAYRIRKFKELRREYVKAWNRYYLKLQDYYRFSLNGVSLSQADNDRYIIQSKLNKLVS